MANTAKFIITVRSSRGASTIGYVDKGRYVSLVTNGLATTLQNQAIQPTASETAFWLSVINVVEAALGGEA